MLRRSVRAVAAASGVGMAALFVDAPTADRGDGSYAEETRLPVFPEWLHDLGRWPIFAAATLVAKVYLSGLNDTRVEGREILIDQLEHKPANKAIITVSNHSATVDDPGIIATMMPWKYAWPRYGRWSFCSQEYCYTKGRLLSAVFFSSKTLPVKRGGGIDHKMLSDIFEKVEQGRWVHIFPEGKIEQNEPLGGRPSPLREEIGRLKWGVAKLIARAKERPVVIPFYHANMEKVMPQNSRNQLISMIPKTGVAIRVIVGEPISFDDLFDQYGADRVVGGGQNWKTQDRERALYSAITRRIEQALLELERRTRSPQKKTAS